MVSSLTLLMVAVHAMPGSNAMDGGCQPALAHLAQLAVPLPFSGGSRQRCAAFFMPCQKGALPNRILSD